MPYQFVEHLESRTHFDVVLPGFAETSFVSGISRATAMEFAPDGRLFVCSQGGALRVVKQGQLLDTPFLNVPASDEGERGLLGVAFDPDFGSNGFVYIYWTTNDPTIHNKVSRFTVSADNPDIADPDSQVDILNLPDLQPSNHNGGAIHFGIDGNLYIGVGENGQPDRAQDPTDLLGKLLRINSDGSVPSDNPFASATAGKEVYALGLRNPFTFAIQKDTGRIFINDVGQGSFEEINEGLAGANYGWPTTEGATTDARFKTPFFTYPHGDSDDSRAITGGTFYPTGPVLVNNVLSPAAFPSSFAGDYFYADVNGGYVKQIDLATEAAPTARKIANHLDSPVDLKVGPDGALYVLSYNGGEVRRIAANPTVDLSASLTTTASGIVVGGDKEQAVVRVTNNGTTRLTGPVTVRLMLSTDDQADDADVVVVNSTKKLKLNPGKSATLKLKFVTPALPDGEYRLLAQADPANEIAETDEANNLASAGSPLLIRFPGTDFSGTFVEPVPTGTFPPGGKAAVSLSVLNSGNIIAKGKLQIRLVAASDTEGTPVGSPLAVLNKSIKLKPGSRQKFTVKFNMPADVPAGSYFYAAVLDSAFAFSELNEADNLVVSASPFTVG